MHLILFHLRFFKDTYEVKIPKYDQERRGDDMLYYRHILPVLLDSFTMRKSAWTG